MKRLVSFLVLSLFLLPHLFPSSSFAYYPNMPATIEIGQKNFITGGAQRGGSTVVANGFFIPSRPATDGKKLVIPAKKPIADATNRYKICFWGLMREFCQ